MTHRLISLAIFAFVAATLVACSPGTQRRYHAVATQEDVFTARADDPYAATMTTSTWAGLRRDLTEARRDFDASPTDEDAIIWLGRRQAYLGLYHEAVATFSRGLILHPGSAKLRRHRGHRFITIRQFDRAVDDLSRAARLVADQPDEIEPDGAPNALNIPRGTLKTNIYYHLALAHYLQGDFERARDAWRTCAELSPNDDMLVAATYWLHLTNKRLGDDDAAARSLEPITSSMDVIENFDYHALLLMFKGEVEPADLLDFESGTGVQQATRAYGAAMLHWFAGDADKAKAILERITREANPAAFGAIAAEVDLERLQLQ